MTEAEFRDEVLIILSDILPNGSRGKQMLDKSIGYLHSVWAFKAYSAGEIYSGLVQAVAAVRHDIQYAKNRGLWMLPLRNLMALDK